MKRLSFALFGLAVLLFGACDRTPSAGDRAGETPVNLIFMIGDGMGLGHVSMLQIEEGYDRPTSFMAMRNIALIKSYSHNNRVTDSAAAGTALATGHKTDNGMLGMLPDSTPVESMMSKAVRQGLSTGLVVTCYLPHATPAAFYAHVSSRNDNDRIVDQFVDSGIDVALGGGRKYFTRACRDGRSAVELLRAKGYAVVNDLAGLDSVGSGRVVGLFADGQMPFAHEGRDPEYLPHAVRKALEVLDRNARERDKGFLLMVEGSRIDNASHANDLEGILAEMRDFDRAVREAMAYTDAHPGTLLVVTADHETGGLTMASGNTDFLRSESGIRYACATGGHTGILIPVYLYGTGAERINGVMENSELGRRLMELLGLE